MILNKVRKYIEKYQLLNFEEKVIVGLSGGADSVVLLYILKELGYSCIAAHCNFHLRGEESNRDEEFVVQLTSDWNIPLFRVEFDTLSIASDRKISIEMAARDLRYEWFGELRREQKAQAVCVAHHQDDNVETMLINLIRGTGIKGLSGMQPKNGHVVRPLLVLSRQDVMQLVERYNLHYVTDSTNLEDDFVRNRIRLQVLPLLRTINPSVEGAILQSIENLNQVQTVYRYAIDDWKAKVFCAENNSIFIPDLLRFASPEALLFEILREFDFNPDVVREVYQALRAQSGKEFFSPTHRLVKDRDILLILPHQKGQEEQEQEEILLDKENVRIDFPMEIEIHLKKRNPDFKVNKSRDIASLDADRLTFPLKLRRWRTGDKFIPLGMTQFQKLSDFFINNKFSKPQKENVWLLTSADDIVWIVGWRMDDRYKVTPETKNLFVISTGKIHADENFKTTGVSKFSNA